MGSPQLECTVKTQETFDEVVIQSGKEGANDLKEENDTGTNISEDADHDTIPPSDSVSISEQNDSCASTEEQGEIKPVCSGQTGEESQSECTVTEDLSQPKTSLALHESHTSPIGADAISTSQQNGMHTGYAGVNGYGAVGSGKSETDVGGTSSVYRDYSRLPCADDGNGIIGTAAASGKEPPFPVKLHKILSKTEFADVVSWLPHGRSWRVLKPKAFEEKVVPLYFRHAKYASFMRQVNGWGFKRMTQGPDHNSYYHELFLRGLPHLCLKMRRPARAKPGSTDSDINPDFYRLSMVAPLPNPGNPAVKETSLQGIHDLGVHSNALANLTNMQPSALGVQTHVMPTGGLTNMHFPNLGMGGLGSPNLSANALFHHQIHGQFQPQLGNIGQQLGFTPGNPGGNNALGVADVNTAMTQQIGALRQRREDLVRQLQMINSGHNHGAASTPPNGQVNAPEPAGSVNNSNQTSSTLQPHLSLQSSDHNNLLSANGANATQLQQMMLSQLQAAGMSGPDGNIAHQQSFGNMGIGSAGMQQFDLSNIPGSVGGNGVGNINPQLLMPHNAMPGLGVSGMNNSLTSPVLGNLGFMMQNHMLPNHNGSMHLIQNQNPSTSIQGKLPLSNDGLQVKCDTASNIYGEKK